MRGRLEEGGRHRHVGRRPRPGRRLPTGVRRRRAGDCSTRSSRSWRRRWSRRWPPRSATSSPIRPSRSRTSTRATCRPNGNRSGCPITGRSASTSTSGRASGPGDIPEVWNDAGTGDQILTTLWQMVMRGADGVGCSDAVPQWHFALAGNTDDPRTSWNGISSVYRSLNGVLQPYGPWLVSLQPADRVAIVASGRMYKIDDWVGATGRHFARVMEAYVACLHAHRPASIRLRRGHRARHAQDSIKAVLVVGQTVEFEPALAAALKRRPGRRRGRVRRRHLPGRTGQGLHAAGTSPSTTWRRTPAWPPTIMPTGARPPTPRPPRPILAKALASVRPAAEVENPEVFVTERRAEGGRYLFVVNNTTFGELEPGHLWRVTLACSSLVPQVVPVKLDASPRRGCLRCLRRQAGSAARGRRAGRLPQHAGPDVRHASRRYRPGASRGPEGRRPRRSDAVGRAGSGPAGRAIAAAVPVRVRRAGSRRRRARPAVCLGIVPRRRRRVPRADQRARRPPDPRSGRTLQRQDRHAAHRDSSRRSPRRAICWPSPSVRRPRPPLRRRRPTTRPRRAPLPATSRRPTSRLARTFATWSSPTAASWR